MQKKYITVGDIVNTHGLQGELRILSDSDFKTERFAPGSKLLIIDENGDKIEEVIISKYRVHKSFDLLTFKNFQHISHVEKFKGKFLALPLDSLEKLNEDTFYIHEIESCDVYLHDEKIGKVHKIVSMGSYDLWYIKRAEKKDLIIPYKDEFVQKIDILKQRIDITILPGMEEL